LTQHSPLSRIHAKTGEKTCMPQRHDSFEAISEEDSNCVCFWPIDRKDSKQSSLARLFFHTFVIMFHTVASEKDGFMSETMIEHRNLPNPHLFEPLSIPAHDTTHPPYQHIAVAYFEAIYSLYFFLLQLAPWHRGGELKHLRILQRILLKRLKK
jgi:hypothetical protein